VKPEAEIVAEELEIVAEEPAAPAPPAAESEVVETAVEVSESEPPAANPPAAEPPAAEPEATESAADAAEDEPAPAEEAETVVAALEPEPFEEEAPVEEPAVRTPSETEREWARIYAALDQLAEPGNTSEDPAEMQFDLAGVIIDGSSVYTPRELLPDYRSFLGREISVSDLHKISAAITELYAADGYGETTAQVPTQMIRSGVVTIRIQEEFFNNMIIFE